MLYALLHASFDSKFGTEEVAKPLLPTQSNTRIHIFIFSGFGFCSRSAELQHDMLRAVF
jgi:hypothetical protein